MYEINLPVTQKSLGHAPLLDDAPEWIYQLDNPYLHGAYAPTINSNSSADNLTVIGEIPADLYGAYYRNGPNPEFKPSNRYHPFDGDGLINGVFFQDGMASFKSRMIHTRALQAERAEGASIWPGVMGPFDFSLPDSPIKDTANTDVILHNGQLITLWYNAGRPYVLDPLTLKNKGPFDAPGRLSRRMSAHTRVDWQTGEMLFFDYGDEPPYMTYGVANPDGSLKHEVAIDLPGPRLPHELAFTANYAVLHDHPLFHDPKVLKNHKMRLLQFHRDMPTRFGLIPRLGSEVTWFECEPCFVLHTSNAWEDGEWVVMDGCRSTNPMPDADPSEGVLSHMLAYMRLEANNYRWRFNLRTGEVREGPLDDLNTEFNKSNPIFHGVQSRYAYHQYIPLVEEGGHTLRFNALIKYDNETGQSQRWDYGDGVYGSEAAFAPKQGANRDSVEDDGYLVTIVTDSSDWTSSSLVFDAKDITRGPIAEVKLPHRVPVGFHGCWGRGDELYAQE
ncbi:MAG: carotenoid cleavage dioxygenase-like enzyme [Cryomorphaceae bacterium]|jgi:carotenoid cleavage dioxygenase-like enzyme